MVLANLSATGASFYLDLSCWKGARTREVLWGCDYPLASEKWFVYLPSYGFSWWLIGDVEELISTPESSKD